MGATKPVTVGGMHDFFQYARQVTSSLFALNRFPGDYLPPSDSIFHGPFVKYFQENPRGMIDFDFAFIAWPRIKQQNYDKEPLHQPKKNNMHGLLFSRFWREFLDPFITEHGYKKTSQEFMKDFLKLNSAHLHGAWAEHFHLHFVDPSIVEPTDEFWRQYISSEHGGRIAKLVQYEFSLMRFAKLNMADILRECDIGFRAVSTKTLCDRVSSLR